MKLRTFEGRVYADDLEDTFNGFFNEKHKSGQGGVMDDTKRRLQLDNVTLDPGGALFLLGGRNSIIKGLRENGDKSVGTADGMNLVISFKANITRKKEFLKTVGTQIKTKLGKPIAMMRVGIKAWQTLGAGVAFDIAKGASKGIDNVSDTLVELQEYNAKTSVIVQIYNNNTKWNSGEGQIIDLPAPEDSNKMIADKVTYITLANLLDNLIPK